MGLVLSVIAGMLALSASIVGNVIASDLCASSPWLIRRAAQRVAPVDRERYEEEWVADLVERDSVSSQLKHAIGCFFCAHRIRRAAGFVTVQLSLIMPAAGTVTLDYRVNMKRPFPFMFKGVNSENALLKRISVIGALFYFFGGLLRSAYCQLDRQQFKLFANNIKELIIADYRVKVFLKNDKHLDLTALTKAYFEDPPGKGKKIPDKLDAMQATPRPAPGEYEVPSHGPNGDC